MSVNLEVLKDKLNKSIEQKAYQPGGYVGTFLTTDEIEYILKDIQIALLFRDIMEVKQ